MLFNTKPSTNMWKKLNSKEVSDPIIKKSVNVQFYHSVNLFFSVKLGILKS